jgi:hypothetical protein
VRELGRVEGESDMQVKSRFSTTPVELVLVLMLNVAVNTLSNELSNHLDKVIAAAIGGQTSASQCLDS